MNAHPGHPTKGRLLECVTGASQTHRDPPARSCGGPEDSTLLQFFREALLPSSVFPAMALGGMAVTPIYLRAAALRTVPLRGTEDRG